MLNVLTRARFLFKQVLEPLDDMNLEDEILNLEDEISDLVLELVTGQPSDLFLKRLFSLKAGKWTDAAGLCKGLAETQAQITELLSQVGDEDTLQVMWLEYPDTAQQKGYCLILFFVELLSWTNSAFYNKQGFFETQNKQMPELVKTNR